ncbi:MAG: small subunit ribosomal protein S20 [Anaerolineaceae bacterium]|nr:MAG: small subunit ribosomal protein S20 [Anaerolineaceae bacterium]
MANIKSQIKRNRQNDKRRLRNRAYRGQARIAVREARVAMDASAPESKEQLLKAVSALDKAAEKGVIHKNNAARRKSRLMKQFAKMGPVQAAPAQVKPVAEAVPAATSSPKGKKAAPRKRAAVKAEPKAEAKPKAEPKKTAAKKTEKKTETKKTTTRKTTAKK